MANKTVFLKGACTQYTTRSESVNRWFHDINRLKLDEKKESLEQLLVAAQSGSEKAVNRLVEANLSVVVSVAKLHDWKAKGLLLEDLISEGSIGLLAAAREFDANNGCEFVTYAVLKIHQYILRAIEAYGDTIHLPKNASKAGITFVFDSGDSACYTDEEGADCSLFSSFQSDDDAEIGIRDLDAQIKVAHLLNKIQQDKDAEVICKLFGIGTREHTQRELADEYGMTSEGIRRLKLRVLKEMRNIADTIVF